MILASSRDWPHGDDPGHRVNPARRLSRNSDDDARGEPGRGEPRSAEQSRTSGFAGSSAAANADFAFRRPTALKAGLIS